MRLQEVIRGSLLTISVLAMAALMVASTDASAQSQSNWRAEKDICVNKGNSFSIEATIGSCTALLVSSSLPKQYVPYAFYNRGIAFEAERNYDRAIDDYTNAVRLKPDFAHALYNRAHAYQAKGDIDRAIADYTEAVQVDPNYASAINNRGLAYEAKGDNGRAIADFSEAIRIDPKFAHAYRNRGSLYRAEGDIGPAIADLYKANQLGEDGAR